MGLGMITLLQGFNFLTKNTHKMDKWLNDSPQGNYWLNTMNTLNKVNRKKWRLVASALGASTPPQHTLRGKQGCS